MNKEEILRTIEPTLKERGCFLVEVSISADDDIEIVIEREEGTVDWDDCAAIDKVVHEAFNQDDEDYALTVSSAGLDRPFKVQKQYLKAMGSLVDVKFKGGRRLTATLTAADIKGSDGKPGTGDSITLSYTALETVEGQKKKQKVLHEDTYPLSDINSVTPYIEFK